MANPADTARTDSRRCVVELLGFTEAEKSLLSSTFRLTGRRAFSYAEASAPHERADIYLVNADVDDALQKLQTRSPNVLSPALLIGRQPVNSPWPLVAKPIQWMRLFEQLDSQIAVALRERALRQTGAGPWDGRVRRRAVDQALPPEPVMVEARPAESVLVVDDSATVRAFMRTRLAPFRFDIDYADSGELAIDMAQAKNYTCIFLDILMPGMDGYQVCKRIKSSPGTKGTAVVMLSSKSSAFDKFRGSWAGCDAYLGKPVSEDELLSTIARFLPSARRVAQSMLTRTA